MAGIASKPPDGESDYGSDLNSDEEVSLTELLQQTPSKENRALPPLQLNDIEDNEGPKTARLPRVLGRDKASHGEEPMQSGRTSNMRRKQSVPIEITNHRSASAPGKLEHA